MEIYIIELPKFKRHEEKDENKKLNSWLKFIENPEVIDMKDKNDEIVKAKKVLEEISQDEHEIYLAELREKYIMDQKAIEGAGYDKGLKDGIEKGIQQGKKDSIIAIAKKMKTQNIEINVISQVTGLAIEEIKDLK